MTKPRRLSTLKPRVATLAPKTRTHVVERDRSTAWKRARYAYLSAHPTCEYCAQATPPRLSAATILEHRTPLWAGGSMWDEANWAASCDECARAKTAREAADRARGG